MPGPQTSIDALRMELSRLIDAGQAGQVLTVEVLFSILDVARKTLVDDPQRLRERGPGESDYANSDRLRAAVIKEEEILRERRADSERSDQRGWFT